MSLVLDALLKAQSQRGRGEVPSVSTGLNSLGSAPPPVLRVARPPWAWVLGAVLLTALAAWALVSWRGAVHPGPQPLSGQHSAEPRPEGQAGARPEPVPAQATPPALSAPPPQVRPPAQAPLPAPQIAASPPPSKASAPLNPTRATPTLSEAASATTVASAPAPGPVARAAAVKAEVSAIPSRAELPPALRQALPPLAVSGMVYARDPAQRMVLINGELWRQGDTVAPGLVLEEIRAKDLVMRYQGQQSFSLSP